MADNDDTRNQSFSQRYAAKRTRADDEVSDWINGPGQIVLLVVGALVVVWFVARIVLSLF